MPSSLSLLCITAHTPAETFLWRTVPRELLSAAAPRLHTLSRSEVRQYLLGGWERAVFPYLQRARRVVESTRAAGCPVSRVPLAHVDVSLSENFQSGLLCL